MKKPELEFRINSPAFLKEIFNNNPTLGRVLFAPANIFQNYLYQIAERASQLNDPKLNAIMCQMSLYEIADPYSSEYNQEATNKIISGKYKTIE